MKLSKDGLPRIFHFLPCALSIVTGESGGGKSFFAMWCAWHFIKAGGHVFSNVVIAQLQPNGKWDDKKRPARCHLVESWAEFFRRLSEVLLKEPTARILLIIDEAASSLSAYDWQSETAKILRSSVTLKRKWGEAHIMIISMQNSLILKAIRETGEEGGLLDIKFLKNKWAIERHGSHFLARGHDYREIVVVQRVELEEPEAYTLSVAEQLAKPVELCSPGDFAYATLGQSTWGLGVHPHTEEGKWSWQQFLAIQSGIWPDAIPQLMYAYWHQDPATVIKGESPPEVDTANVVETESESRVETLLKMDPTVKREYVRKDWDRVEALRMRREGMSFAKIAEALGVKDYQSIQQYIERLKKEGKF
jgi:hypothetical protein